MSKKPNTIEKPQEPEEITAPACGDKLGLPDIRLECLKSAHSASKSVTEILNDAEIYTLWVTTGKKSEVK